MDFAETTIQAGCSGLAIGRRVFTNPDPERLVRELTRIVHGPSHMTSLPRSIPDQVGTDAPVWLAR
jgi:2-amino-4,5-dihydroxy-6-oxo-7-(phosphonooxy)heptanoate synthase